jgi:hypothetical protein
VFQIGRLACKAADVSKSSFAGKKSLIEDVTPGAQLASKDRFQSEIEMHPKISVPRLAWLMIAERGQNKYPGSRVQADVSVELGPKFTLRIVGCRGNAEARGQKKQNGSR